MPVERAHEITVAMRTQQLSRIGRNMARSKEAQPVYRWKALDRFRHLASARQYVGQPWLLVDAENLVHARPPHVGVDEKHPLSGLGERHRQIRGDDALAFSGSGAGDDDRAHAVFSG